MNFNDIRKAFDSVNRISLWNISKNYGIPPKMINIIRSFYEDSRCSVKVDGLQGEWFEVIRAVRQGCVLSSLLFALVIDWIMSHPPGGMDVGLHLKGRQ